MFERYTEKARRVIFFARYEAMGLGSPYIESQHLLLGLMRETKVPFDPPRFPFGSREDLRKRIEDQAPKLPPSATSVDLPLAAEAKRILAYAAEEAEALDQRHIGTEHILLGILREQESIAAKLLSEYGLTVEVCRLEVKEGEKSEQGLAQKEAEQARARRLRTNVAQSLLPMSAEGFRVLAFAIEEAEALGQTAVGIDHLLLGVLRHGKSVAAKLLAERGVEAEAIRRELKRTTEGTQGEPKEGANG
jgi:ATP-dependent Clp protease ATP-binding subunit ClpC